MKKALLIVSMVAIVAIAGSMIYYFVFFKTEQAREQLRLEEVKIKQEQNAKTQNLLSRKAAITELDNWRAEADYFAYEEYKSKWNFQCEQLNKPADSSLPKNIAKELESWLDKEKNIIAEEYKAKLDAIIKQYD